MVVKYLPRILDEDLEKYLTMIGAILIVGPMVWQDNYCWTACQKCIKTTRQR